MTEEYKKTYLENLLNETYAGQQKVHRTNKKDEVPEEKTIKFSHLVALNVAAGSDTAIKLLTNYDVQDMLRADRIVEQMNFPGTPAKGKERIDTVIKCLNLFGHFNGNFVKPLETWADYWHKVGMSFDDLGEIVEAVDDGKEKEYYFWRDTICDAAGKLLEKYGVKADENTPEGVFKGAVHREWFFLPGSTNAEVAKVLVEEDIYRRGVNGRLQKGFDDWRVAVEFAKRYERGSDGPYIALGLTTMEAVKAIKPGAVSEVWNVFGNVGDFDAKRYIDGSIDTFKSLLKRAKEKNARKYFAVVNGSIDEFDTIMGYAKEDRPLPEAMGYAGEHFGKAGILRIIDDARAIDTEHTDLFRIATGSPAEFRELTTRYETALATFHEAAGDDASCFLDTMEFIEFIESYDKEGHRQPDLRFFSDYSLSDDGIGKAKFAAKHLAFGEYIKMGDSEFSRTSAVQAYDVMSKLGYNKKDIIEMIPGNHSRNVKLMEFAAKLVGTDIPIDDFKLLYKSGFKGHVIRTYLDTGLVGEGEGKLPSSAVPLMENHHICSIDLKLFAAVYPLKNYIGGVNGDSGFDSTRFVQDYRVFKNTDVKTQPQTGAE
ncbi:hypothetical protein ACFL6I_22505 [candidate division KSB1 bacterium]